MITAQSQPPTLALSSNLSPIPDPPTSESLPAVPFTSLVTAAWRAFESARPAEERRFYDPYAAKLASPRSITLANEVITAWRESKAEHGLPVGTNAEENFIAERTVYFDRQLMESLAANPDCKQVVTVGSGMDTRPFRLDIPADMKWFEVDFASIHAYKSSIIGDARPACQITPVAADMATDDWSTMLVDAGLDRTQPTVWIAEGLMYYIPVPAIAPYLERVNYLSSPGSVFIFDAFRDCETGFVKLGATWLSSLENAPLGFTSSRYHAEVPLMELGWRLYDDSRTFPETLENVVMKKH